MEPGVLKIAEDDDFQRLKEMVDGTEEWALEFDKGGTKVWTKQAGNCTFKMVKVICDLPTVNPLDLYDVIHDPDYRKTWDQSMIESIDIGYLNPNNDVSYYAVSCPAPMTNRDFVLQRSWLDMGNEQYIINHSVFHKDYPPRKGYIRGNSIFTGYLIRQTSHSGCTLGYVTQSDMQGDLPLWLVNKCTNIFAPKYVKQLEKAAVGYRAWKASHNSHLKPWHYPEQISSPKLSLNLAVTEVPMPMPQKIINKPPMTSEIPSFSAKPVATPISRQDSLKESVNESQRKTQLMSCLNFTRHCLGNKNEEPSLP